MTGAGHPARPEVPFERSVSLATARATLERSLAACGLAWRLQARGRHVTTAKCTLYDGSGTPVEAGFGKGEPDAAQAGALFEAAEHWFGRFGRGGHAGVVHRNSRRYARSTRVLNGLLTHLIEQSAPADMALRSYRRLGGRQTVLYPVGLSDPKYVDARYEGIAADDADRFDYSRIEAYCSNSGVAIGSSEVDATIHGLLETVERDALSEFLVGAFLLRQRHRLRVVAPASLPADLKRLKQRVQAETGHAVMLVELANRFGIPVFCAALDRSASPIEATGYGCSLSRLHAARRSLYELVQGWHISQRFHPAGYRRKHRQIEERFRKHPFHLRCAQMMLGPWIREIGCDRVAYGETASVDAPEDLDAYLGAIVRLLERQGHRAYAAVLATLPGGEAIVHSLFDRQEHFFCAVEGLFVLPDMARWPDLASA